MITRLLTTTVLFTCFELAVLCKPSVTITSPIIGSLYKGGDVITFSGIAYDDVDGFLPASAFVWYLDFHHSDHVHDGPPILRNANSGTYQLSTTNEVDADVFYRLILIVTNSRDETDTATVDIMPKLVNLTIASNFNGVKYSQFGTAGTFTTPSSRMAVQNMFWIMFLQKEQVVDGDTLVLVNWAGTECSEAFTFDVPTKDTTLWIYFEKKSDRRNRTVKTHSTFTTIDTVFQNNISVINSCIHTLTSAIVSVTGCGNLVTTTTSSVCSISSITSNIGSGTYTTNELKVYPNASCDYITIHNTDLKKVLIYDALGVLHTNYNYIYYESNYLLNISNLKPGIYYLKVQFNHQQTATSKFIKY